MATDDTSSTPPALDSPAVPRPAPPPPSVPPPPATPAPEPPVLRWLRTPRPAAAPGIWTYGHRPRPDEEPDQAPLRRLVGGAVLSGLAGWFLWNLLYHGYLGWYWMWPLMVLGPDGGTMSFVVAAYIYYALVIGILVVVFGRLGRWPDLARRVGGPLLREIRERRADVATAAPEPAVDPAQWPDVRAAGATAAADRLAADARAGRMNDVDAARIDRAWRAVRAGRTPLAAFSDAVLKSGAAAYGHPSGQRDLPRRTAHHDLLARQVRIGIATDHPRNPHQHRDAGVALDPDLLRTSLLAVGPSGCGKSARLVRPVVESLCLQSLAGRCAVIAVGPAGTDRGPDDAFDVVVRLGHPDGPGTPIDLYGTTDPDEAAGVLAEALLGDHPDRVRPAVVALGRILGPVRAARHRFPSVPELRGLLSGDEGALQGLRADLEAAGESAALRDLDARARQSQHPEDVGMLLADRVALLDRPAFADCFGAAGARQMLSLQAVDRPLRVRVDLPARGHVEAARILARLVLAQFTECATARADREVFACLVLDDAAHVVTADALRGLQRLRSANAGVVLTLRTLDDVPEQLRSALLGAVGCRMAFAGVTTWDGTGFADVWGKEWVETRDVTDRQIIAESAGGKAFHLFRQMVTGKAATAKAVTVRTVERERWSASDLANSVPAGHAVLSVTSARGEHAPPVLVDLRDTPAMTNDGRR
ncbi:ATP-binding protein [Streptomyces platensis]|uniref:ATP-binding protein n=1 Tax=Streptomyces platensis TaxID=58346 RepID=UPI0036818684